MRQRMTQTNALFSFAVYMGDNSLVLGHRLSEWCGHGPVLEQDIAMTNISLDLIGQARMYYQLAADLEARGRTEDDLAYLRVEREYTNVLLVEQPNGDFAQTVMRQFLYDAWHLPFLKALCDSPEQRLSEIAGKAVKEATYHLKWSREWVLRLGDGTEESHRRIHEALQDLWIYREELLLPADFEEVLIDAGILPAPTDIRPLWQHTIVQTLHEAGLEIPVSPVIQKGGKTGIHTEHLGHLLSELQYVQRAYPGQVW
jgi:ring-1,2-phenylacetyl-CoA epoxidase subunit PaaC